MGFKYVLCLLFISCLATFLWCSASRADASPLSFERVYGGAGTSARAPQFIKTSDGIDLAFYALIPRSKPVAALIFLHGGGAWSGAGYEKMAEGLRSKHSVSVYLVDLRGHGKSGGPRGDSPTVERVWQDLKAMVLYAREKNARIPLFLGGHSSGGGLVLNYATWAGRADVDGYIFLSPQLGHKSQTARGGNGPSFVTVKKWVFLLSAISGGKLLGRTPAVILNYPEQVRLSQPLLLEFITRNMAIAITPSNPQEQFARLDRPFGLFVGNEDELFQPEKVIRYAKLAPTALQAGSISGIEANETHLSILLRADEYIWRAMALPR